MRHRLTARHLLVLCLALLTPLHASAQTWREIQSPHFRVLTDGTDAEGRNVAHEFEQMRSVFAALFKNPVLDTGAPLLIVAVHEPGLKTLAPVFYQQRDKVAGVFFRGWERQFALVRLDGFGDRSQAVVFHEYTHTILHANVHWLPTWLDEGLAEFYAYTRFEGDHIDIGGPSVRLAHLKTQPLIPIPQMMTATSATFFSDKQKNDLFYGEAWAMVHYISYGKHMGNGAKLTSFVHLMEQGTPQTQAFQQTFGDPQAFQQQLATYISTLANAPGTMREVRGPDPTSFTVKALTPAETDYAIGSFDIGAHDDPAGATLLRAAAKEDPALAGPHEEIGFLAWRAGHDDLARFEWQQAVAADPAAYRSTFALLMSGSPLNQQSPQQLAQTQHTLEAIHTTAPKFAPAVVELALIQWQQGHLTEAYKTSLAAETLEPWRAEYHLLTGRILLENHQPAAAAAYARQVADRWPSTDHDEAVDLWNLVPPAQRGDGPPLTLSFPPDATIVRGTIVSTACARSGLTVIVQPNAQPSAPNPAPLTLATDGPFENGFADTLWFGEDHYTPCFHLAGLPTVIAYQPSPEGPAHLLVFEVRDNPPTPTDNGQLTTNN
jgi:hypothetical protein